MAHDPSGVHSVFVAGVIARTGQLGRGAPVSAPSVSAGAAAGLPKRAKKKNDDGSVSPGAAAGEEGAAEQPTPAASPHSEPESTIRDDAAVVGDAEHEGGQVAPRQLGAVGQLQGAQSEGSPKSINA